MEKIKESIEYGALDHKWIARNYLKNAAETLTPSEKKYLVDIATSSFKYYIQYKDILDADTSIRAITEMCSDNEHITNIDESDTQVFHLSNVFNQIIESTRKLYQCYDCGTNARAIFLKLIATHRGLNFVTHEEQQRMKNEYLVQRNQTKVRDEIKRCHDLLRSVKSDSVFIMSLAIHSFGHVWVIEKRFLPNARYHHYQTSLNSHILLDFIERKDYGRNLDQCLDIDTFFTDLTNILTNTKKWEDQDYRKFAELFAFLPVNQVKRPNPGFSFTWITY